MSAARILVVDDEADIRGLLKEILSEEGYEVEVAADADQARAARARQSPDLVLLDIWMPGTDGITLLREWSTSATDGCPVVMMSGHGTVETAVEATRLGAFDFVEKPLSLAKLLRTVERALDAGKRRRQPSRPLPPQLLVPAGKSKLMQQLRTELKQIASSVSTALLIGEPGSGREAFARYLHSEGPRAAKPFVALVASSLRDTDAEEQLLGRGESAGLLEQAAGGTLFVQDVEDLPPSACSSRGLSRGSAACSRGRSMRVCCRRRSPAWRPEPARAAVCGAICSRTSTRSSCECRPSETTRRTCPSC